MFRVVSDEMPFEVNEEGVVRNRETKRVYSTYTSDGGYVNVTGRWKGKRFLKLVHRLVAIAFIPNPHNKPQVNHLSGVKADNSVPNLEWNTQSENIKHAFSKGLMKPALGEKHVGASVSDDTAREICKLLELGKPNIEIMKLLGVPAFIVTSLKNGKRWKHITKEFNIPLPKDRTLKREVIIFVCEQLEKGLSNIAISKLDSNFVVSAGTIGYIKQRKSHQDISKHYNF